MEHGHFRHLPVIDEHEKLIGMLTDPDVRQIRPSLAFTSKEEAAVQLSSISVQQAAVFDPISVKPDASLKEAAELMLRWHLADCRWSTTMGEWLACSLIQIYCANLLGAKMIIRFSSRSKAG